MPLLPFPGVLPDALTDRLHIAASGNIGISTSTPQFTLAVAGTGSFSGSVQTPAVNTVSAVALNLGAMNAASINLGDTINSITAAINGTPLVNRLAVTIL